MRVETRVEQHILAVAVHDILLDLCIAVASHQPLPHQHAQVAREIGIAVIDGLVLAHQAPQALGDVTRALLEGRIGQHLVGTDGKRPRRKNNQQCEEGGAQCHCAASGWCLRARCGTPTRRRRSVRDRTPAPAMTRAPIQISRI
ncbi:hypothetical protein D3C87_1765040 [compost metagenome]